MAWPWLARSRKAGAAVVLTSRSAERAATAAAQMPGASGIAADVRDEAAAARVVEQAWSRLGGIDVLVNNAGLGMKTVNPRFMVEPLGFWEVPAGGFRAVLDTNLTGYFLMAREVVPRMLNAEGRTHRQHLDESFHHEPAWFRPLRTRPSGSRGAVPDHGS